MDRLGPLIPFVLIAVVFWLLLIRPQRKRQMELLATQRGLHIGDGIMLGAGIVARVTELPDEGELIEVELAPGVRVRVARASVARVLPPPPADAEPESSEVRLDKPDDQR